MNISSPDFNPEEFLNQSPNSTHIEGIYNYCDRWCERCTMSKHCVNYENNIQAVGDDDLKNEKFWNDLSQMWENTIKLIYYVAEEKGIDLKETSDDLIGSKRKNNMDVMKHPLVLKSLKYCRDVDKMIDEDSWLKEKSHELKKKIDLGWDNNLIISEAKILKDCLDVIHWYSPQIMVKLSRALGADSEHEIWCKENGFPRDSDGSAKVALIGIDRSIATWGKLMEIFSEKSDQILDLLVILEQLRKSIEYIFPYARSFKRPGFDK